MTEYYSLGFFFKLSAIIRRQKSLECMKTEDKHAISISTRLQQMFVLTVPSND